MSYQRGVSCVSATTTGVHVSCAARAWRGERLTFDVGATPTQMFSRLWDQLIPDSVGVRRCRARLFALRGGSAARCTRTVASTGIALLGSCWTSMSVSCVQACRCRPTLSPAPRSPTPPSSPVRCSTRPSMTSRSWRWRGCA